MSIAKDIIQGRMPDLKAVIQEGESLDDVDEYGFTPLIECAIAQQPEIAQALLHAGADVNMADVTGRSPLHWAIYQSDLAMSKLFLEHGADPNAYTRDGLSILVYPVLRRQDALKQLLFQYGAKLEFSQDFIHAKLLGHRFQLQGDVDILNARGEFIEVDYEGFILEFTVALVKDALYRFISSFSTRHLRPYFPWLYPLLDALDEASQMLQLQHVKAWSESQRQWLAQRMASPMLVLPAASRGHAMGFVRYHNWWAKIDRGEHSAQEGSVNIYRITRPEALNFDFLKKFLFQRQPRKFFHQTVHQVLGLEPYLTLPIEAQIVGNCSWANIQAILPAACCMQQLHHHGTASVDEVMNLFNAWVTWDQDRALDECVNRFYHASFPRKASIAAILGAVLFQALDASQQHDVERAEKIMPVLGLPEYQYILNSYYEIYCISRLSRRGNNLLKLMDECGINPAIGVQPIATGLKKKRK
jgi:hypothetical protein